MTAEKLYLKKPSIGEIEDFRTYENYTYPESKDLSISIVIPVYNEENSIMDVIQNIPNHNQYELLIIDDGSTDDSLNKVKEIDGRDIKLIHHHKNLGYGAAILTGFKYATGDIIITMDSDGQHNPEEIPDLISPIVNNKADLVIGSRYMGKSLYKIPLLTRFGESVVNFCLNLLFSKRIRNNQCGFRAIKKNVIKIFNNMQQTGMGFSTELIFKAAYNQYRIIEIPISVNPRKFGTSYVNLINITKSIASCIFFIALKKFNFDVNKFFSKSWIRRIFRMISNLKIFR